LTLDADFASYETFIERQARNKTFVKLFDKHVQRWNKETATVCFYYLILLWKSCFMIS